MWGSTGAAPWGRIDCWLPPKRHFVSEGMDEPFGIHFRWLARTAGASRQSGDLKTPTVLRAHKRLPQTHRQAQARVSGPGKMDGAISTGLAATVVHGLSPYSLCRPLCVRRHRACRLKTIVFFSVGTSSPAHHCRTCLVAMSCQAAPTLH